MNTTIILIRHAESFKNLKDIHGGHGEALTDYGKYQTNILSNRLKRIGVCSSKSVIIYAENIQTKETAEIISKNLKIPAKLLSDYRPLHLGIVHGLSNAEVAEQHPEAFTLLQQWRKKEIEICDLKIPKMESPEEFYLRGLRILQRLDKGKFNIFIATNSLYILLLNILLGNSCEKGGGYRHFDIQNCGISVFLSSFNDKFYLVPNYTNVQDVLLYHQT